MKTSLHECSFIISRTSAGYTSSACPPQNTELLLRTFILEMRSHRSYVRPSDPCGMAAGSTALPYSDLCTKLLRSTPGTTSRLLPLWPCSWCECDAYPLCWFNGSAWVQASPGLSLNNPCMVWYNEKNCFEKQDQPIVIHGEKAWEQTIHMNYSLTFRSSSSDDASVWSLSSSPSLRED